MNGLWQALAPVVELILRVLLDVLVENANAPDTAVSADRNAARRRRLLERLRAHQDKDRPDPAG
jgi:hypothetical protein